MRQVEVSSEDLTKFYDLIFVLEYEAEDYLMTEDDKKSLEHCKLLYERLASNFPRCADCTTPVEAFNNQWPLCDDCYARMSNLKLDIPSYLEQC